ncbi:MAG: site-specific integrase [Armatimonadetes bacterium]|nr:site-specific integrase [Armatimonadota bacterium]
MDEAVQAFLDHLTVERGLSQNTISAYGHDLAQFVEHARKSGINSLADVTEAVLVGFLDDLRKSGISANSASRKLSAIKTFTKFAYQIRLCSRPFTRAGFGSPS